MTPTVQDLINTKNSLDFNVDELTNTLRQLSYVVKVIVVQRGSWYDFQLTTNQEFLDDNQLDHIFELVIDSNLDTRQRTGKKVYFKHSFVGVEKYYVEDEEFSDWFDAYFAALELVDESLSPSQFSEEVNRLIETREI